MRYFPALSALLLSVSPAFADNDLDLSKTYLSQVATSLAQTQPSGIVFVLLYHPGTDEEGIHSVETEGGTLIMLFESEKDAVIYTSKLKAQNFPVPTVKALLRAEIDQFIAESKFKGIFVRSGIEIDPPKKSLLP